MKKVVIILVFLISVWTVCSTEVRVIPELVKPTQLLIEASHLFVVEGTTVQIFDLDSLKKIGQFGKAGQGPQEFFILPGNVELTLSIQNSEIVVASIGKISRWTLNGKYISELSHNPQNGFLPNLLKNGRFLAITTTQGDDKQLYRSLFLCDEKMNRIKELYKQVHNFQPGKGTIVLPEKPWNYTSDEHHIYLPGKENNQVDAFDLDLKLKYTVTVPQDDRSLDQEFKDRMMEEINADPTIKQNPDLFKPFIFPDKYPSISFFGAEEKKLLVFTWNWGKDSLEYYCFDNTNGKILGKFKIPVRFQSAVQPYPFTFKNGKLFQIVENEDEEWELISTPLQ